MHCAHTHLRRGCSTSTSVSSSQKASDSFEELLIYLVCSEAWYLFSTQHLPLFPLQDKKLSNRSYRLSQMKIPLRMSVDITHIIVWGYLHFYRGLAANLSIPWQVFWACGPFSALPAFYSKMADTCWFK